MMAVGENQRPVLLMMISLSTEWLTTPTRNHSWIEEDPFIDRDADRLHLDPTKKIAPSDGGLNVMTSKF
jgi:hypothetical protein